MRLIDADALNPMRCPRSIAEMREWIDNAPTIDAVPKHQLLEETSTLDTCPYYHHEPTGEPFCEMEDRRHGKWTLKMNERFYWKECSMCGHKPPRSDEYGTYIESNYCPNCGADMRGEDK